MQLLDKISTFGYLQALMHGRESRQAGTGEWFFSNGANCDSYHFQKWFNDDSSSLLWCHGSRKILDSDKRIP